jgi:hypothetical protein
MELRLMFPGRAMQAQVDTAMKEKVGSSFHGAMCGTDIPLPAYDANGGRMVTA